MLFFVVDLVRYEYGNVRVLTEYIIDELENNEEFSFLSSDFNLTIR